MFDAWIYLSSIMKATIVSHEEPHGSAAEIHRFRFLLEDGNEKPLEEAISLRTARVIVENLADGNAFIKMLHAIVSSDPADYDALIGKAFPDHFRDQPAANRPMPGKESEGPCP
ncbi:hypothetical protein [Caballeronia sp. LZ001]|uniref:hypothetical protein n=1 Tax=Caballeronia sp. LZ001 TaxID=3038553 RepID=UPI0028576A10|nr:hypothetical protein [Caballeronia sp. LZ001]MDR5806128.1 hypothetical protein [Caballeronia sp. LZ001]